MSISALTALFNHAVSERQERFSTSFTNLSTHSTQDEDLTTSVIEESSDSVACFIEVIPKALYDYCLNNDATDEQILLVSMYVQEMFEDIALSNKHNS